MQTTNMVRSEAARKGHIWQLTLIFCLWKALLLSLAAFCPGPGYDTSALILLDPSANRHENFSNLAWYDRLTLNLLRWDALYFVKAAERDKIHEQEWAFSWVYSGLLGMVTRYVTDSADSGLRQYVVAGIVTSNVYHLLSVFVLYRLLRVTLGPWHRYQVALVGAFLHILTPASLFLSAPYTEALFSLLNWTGMLLYAQSRAATQLRPPSLQEDALKLSSGILFATATLMRSNGLLSGLILLYDIARYSPRIISMRLTVHDVRRIAVSCVAGGLIMLGFVWPQYLAYEEFCTRVPRSEGPSWCSRAIPSIYSWVQTHYWNVGLFRYWTLPNLPLFLVAAPMLWLLLLSSATVLRSVFHPLLRGRPVPQSGTTVIPGSLTPVMIHAPELALPQLVLAVAALTSFHVQIVNRIASGYPTWYLMVSTWLMSDQTVSSILKHHWRSQWVVRGMIMYAIVQGTLFSNFLPPA